MKDFAIFALVIFTVFVAVKCISKQSKYDKEHKDEHKDRHKDKRKSEYEYTYKPMRSAYSSYYKKDVPAEKIIVIDTETTGLGADDEILQLSIIDYYGNILFDEYIKPVYKKSWERAQIVNNISPYMVMNKKHISEYTELLKKIVYGKVAVGYNVKFDLRMLERNSGVAVPRYIDVMEPFSEVYGQYDAKHGDYRWQKLITCARYYNYGWEHGVPHDALSDCFATLHCYKEMMSRGQI